MNAQLREKEHWTKPSEPSLSLETVSSEIAERNDGPVNVINLLLRSMSAGGRWLWRTVEQNRSALRKQWSEANAREENLRALRAELRTVMFMKM